MAAQKRKRKKKGKKNWSFWAFIPEQKQGDHSTFYSSYVHESTRVCVCFFVIQWKRNAWKRRKKNPRNDDTRINSVWRLSVSYSTIRVAIVLLPRGSFILLHSYDRHSFADVLLSILRSDSPKGLVAFYIKITMKYRRQEAWSSTCEKGGVFLENVCQFYHRTKFVRLLRIYCIFACFTYGINYDMGKELVTGRGFYFLPTGNRFDGHDNEKSRSTNFSVF